MGDGDKEVNWFPSEVFDPCQHEVAYFMLLEIPLWIGQKILIVTKKKACSSVFFYYIQTFIRIYILLIYIYHIYYIYVYMLSNMTCINSIFRLLFIIITSKVWQNLKIP